MSVPTGTVQPPELLLKPIRLRTVARTPPAMRSTGLSLPICDVRAESSLLRLDPGPPIYRDSLHYQPLRFEVQIAKWYDVFPNIKASTNGGLRIPMKTIVVCFDLNRELRTGGV